MRDELPNQQRPDVRHLPQTVNFFLKKALPGFTVDTCSEAFILALRKFISFEHLHGYLWRPAHHPTHRVRLALAGDLVSFTEEISSGAQIRQSEASTESRDDLRVTLHRSVKSLESEPAIRRVLENEGKREKPELDEHFELALRWFHTVVRHLNVGLVRLRNNKTDDAEDALQRASIVAGVCLAEFLSLMKVTKARK